MGCLGSGTLQNPHHPRHSRPDQGASLSCVGLSSRAATLVGGRPQLRHVQIVSPASAGNVHLRFIYRSLATGSMSLYQKIFVCTFSLAGLTLATPANAQLGRIFGTVADKVAKEIVGSSSAKRDTSRGRSLEIDTGKGAFSPGTETIFQSDFDRVLTGQCRPIGKPTVPVL